MKKILITGAHGLLGSALYNVLDKQNIIYNPSSKQLNLLNKQNVFDYIKLTGPFDCVYHLAAKVGGVKSNTEHVALYFDRNMQMNMNLLDACNLLKIKKLVCVLSTCIYPDQKYITYPLTEDQLHLGPPHDSNFGYAYAKRMLDVQARAYRQQHGLNVVSAIPNNLLGEHDNFDLENGHVIPSLIRKIWEAKLNNSPIVEIWGDGKPLREFTYAKDAARILEIIGNEYDDSDPINIGNTNEVSIGYVAESIKTFLGYEGNLQYNTEKPSGQFRKPSSNKKLLEKTSWKNEYYTSFEEALKNTCEWFMINYPNVRGVNV